MLKAFITDKFSHLATLAQQVWESEDEFRARARRLFPTASIRFFEAKA